MLKDLKNTARHILIYSIGNISTKLVGFILLPLYTDYLTTKEYGVLAILEVTSVLLIAMVGVRLTVAMMRWCSHEKDPQKVKSIAFTILINLVLLALAFNVIFQPFTKSFARALFSDVSYGSYFRILFLYIAFEVLNQWVLDFFRMRGKPVTYVVLSIIKFATILTLNFYFVKYREMGVMGIILGQLIGSATLFGVSIFFFKNSLIAKIHKPVIKSMYRYGFPLVFATISMYLLSLGDRYMMKYLLDLDSVGVYALGYKVATVTNLLIITSFQTGILPIAYKMYETPGKERFFIKTLTYYTFVLVIFSLGISLFAKEIITLLSRKDEYIIAYTIVPFISLAFIFKGIQYVFTMSMHFVKNTKYNAVIVMGTAIFNIGLNFLLIPRLGIYGSALASITSFFIMLCFFWYFAKKYFNPGYEIKKLAILVILGIGLYCVSLLFDGMSLGLVIALKLLLIISFPFILVLFSFYEKIEVDSIKGAIRKWNKPKDWFQNVKEFLNN